MTKENKPLSEQAGGKENLLRADAARMTRRQFLHAAAAAGIAAPLAGSIFNQAQAQTPKSGGLLKIATGGGSTTDSFDPALCTNHTCQIMQRQWGDTLTNAALDGGVSGQLAKSFEPANKDGSKWAFHLHRGVTFHNGKTMTAADVVATLRRHADEDSKSGALGILRSVTDFTADGDHTVLISLDGPNADFPFLIADYHIVIQPGGYDEKPIGTGPYIIEEAEHGVRYFTRKNPDYYGTPGHVDNIETLVINDGTARVNALTTGVVHMIARVSPKVVSLLQKTEGVDIQKVSGRGHYIFVCHADTPPFDNADLRLALKYAVDREDLVKRILLGHGAVGNDTPINAAYPLFSDDIPQREYDPDRARHHYKKSGHSGPIVLRTAEVAFPGAVDAAVLYQSHAAAAGITLEIKREPDDGYWSEVWNAKPFCASYWGGRPVQDQMFAVGYKSDAEWNDSKWKRSKFDRLLLAARSELDNTKRREIYREMSLMVRDDGGAIIPMFNDLIDATRGLEGYVPHPNGKLSNDFAPMQVWLKA